MDHDKIKVMVNGLPGNASAAETARKVLSDRRLELLQYSFTTPGIGAEITNIGWIKVNLILPEHREEQISMIRKTHPGFITIDFHAALNDNHGVYCTLELPFIMVALGESREQLLRIVASSKTVAVFAGSIAGALCAIPFLARKLKEGVSAKRAFTMADVVRG